MAKRTTRSNTSSPIAAAGAGWQANSTSGKLAAWAGTGPLALGSPGRARLQQALDMREARRDDEGTPHTGPLALGSPGRGQIRQALDMRNAREDDNGTPSQRATANLQRRQTRDAGKGAAPVLSPSQSADFKAANQRCNEAHLQSHAPDAPQDSGRKKGWGPAARIASAQARNAQKLPYNGDPTQAPDYVGPKGSK
jgi:hypothetical protein